MFKKTILAAALISLPAGAAMAKDSTGCGAGTMIFEGQSGLVPQVLAVTTNGISGNQTFGISTGTLGCDTDGTVQASARATQFASANMEKLAHDMAAGGGETLASLADVIGIAEVDRSTFYQAARDNFSSIYVGADTTAGELVDNLGKVMAEDQKLSAYTTA